MRAPSLAQIALCLLMLQIWLPAARSTGSPQQTGTPPATADVNPMPQVAKGGANLASFNASNDLNVYAWPTIDGAVHAIAPDGSGGWYIGGRFSRVGDVDRRNLARIQDDGTVDAWAPVASGPVWSLAAHNGRVFTCAQGEEATANDRVSAYDGTTGVNLWSAETDVSGQFMICPLLPTGDRLYVGGSFGQIGGVERSRLAVLDPASGLLLSTAAPVEGGDPGWVAALALVGDILYLGGDFTNVGGQARSNLAAIDVATGTVRLWNPGADGSVFALAVGGTTLYVGGQFSRTDGQARSALAAFDTSSGALRPWAPAITAELEGGITALAVQVDTVYIGGAFSGVDGRGRTSLAAIDPTSGAALDWSPLLLGQATNPPVVYALASNGQRVVAGGFFVLPSEHVWLPVVRH